MKTIWNSVGRYDIIFHAHMHLPSKHSLIYSLNFLSCGHIAFAFICCCILTSSISRAGVPAAALAYSLLAGLISDVGQEGRLG